MTQNPPYPPYQGGSKGTLSWGNRGGLIRGDEGTYQGSEGAYHGGVKEPYHGGRKRLIMEEGVPLSGGNWRNLSQEILYIT